MKQIYLCPNFKNNLNKNQFRKDEDLIKGTYKTAGRWTKARCFFKCTTIIGGIFLFCLLVFPLKFEASYIVIDKNSGRVLHEVEAFDRKPPASITKIWTVYVALQEANLTDQVTISRHASQKEGSSVYLNARETWSLESLLYATMLQSGNDAAVAVAEHVAGSEEAFAHLMNYYARQNSAKHTWFMNASGLDHPKHLTTAYDMARLFQVAMNDKRFETIATASSYSPEERAVSWMNKHRLVKENKAIAGKTGYTSVAGRTLITEFKREDKQLIVVSLNERNDWNLHTHLANQVFSATEKQTIHGDYLGPDGILIQVEHPFSYLRKENESVRHMVHLYNEQQQGIWTITIGDTQLKFPITYAME